MWQQVRSFDKSKGGTVGGLCLQNVRKGYEIAAKYPNAIGAWNHTEQHKDRSIPAGVDVPLYYSWRTDGHINVRLANGTVWNDGRIYSSLSNFEATTLISPKPVLLGWGESINDVKVIKNVGVTMASFSVDQIKVLAEKGSIPQTPAQLADGATKPAYDVALNFLLTVRNRLETELIDLKKQYAQKDIQIAERDKEILALKAQIAAGGGTAYTKVLSAGTDLYTKV